MIDYEIYYLNLVGELKKASGLLEEYRRLESLTTNSAPKAYIYEAYLQKAIPQGVTTLLYIFRNAGVLGEEDNPSHLDLEEYTTSDFVHNLYDKVHKNKSIVINAFKKFVSLADESLIFNLLEDIRVQREKNEEDLERLIKFLRK